MSLEYRVFPLPRILRPALEAQVGDWQGQPGLVLATAVVWLLGGLAKMPERQCRTQRRKPPQGQRDDTRMGVARRARLVHSSSTVLPPSPCTGEHARRWD